MKRCPFCAEEIQDEAIKCKHCGSMLVSEEKPPWYLKPGMLFIAFLCVGPLMLPLVWIHPKMDRRAKIVWTVVIVVATALLTWVTVWSWQKMWDMYNELEKF